jgi:hypothetical protein
LIADMRAAVRSLFPSLCREGAPAATARAVAISPTPNLSPQGGGKRSEFAARENFDCMNRAT